MHNNFKENSSFSCDQLLNILKKKDVQYACASFSKLENFSLNFWRMFGGCLKNVWKIFEGYLKNVWRIIIILKDVWRLFKGYLKNVWRISIILKDVWRLFEGYLKNVWRIIIILKDVWRLFEVYLKDIWSEPGDSVSLFLSWVSKFDVFILDLFSKKLKLESYPKNAHTL